MQSTVNTARTNRAVHTACWLGPCSVLDQAKVSGSDPHVITYQTGYRDRYRTRNHSTARHPTGQAWRHVGVAHASRGDPLTEQAAGPKTKNKKMVLTIIPMCVTHMPIHKVSCVTRTTTYAHTGM